MAVLASARREGGSTVVESKGIQSAAEVNFVVALHQVLLLVIVHPPGVVPQPTRAVSHEEPVFHRPHPQSEEEGHPPAHAPHFDVRRRVGSQHRMLDPLEAQGAGDEVLNGRGPRDPVVHLCGEGSCAGASRGSDESDFSLAIQGSDHGRDGAIRNKYIVVDDEEVLILLEHGILNDFVPEVCEAYWCALVEGVDSCGPGVLVAGIIPAGSDGEKEVKVI
mmetsp:Transcript_9848/g.27927  ORF Transcript_9848/g.27927 Transcript_9848/m.27927 type:complete len:220 (+) Transcript_9848:187-846(+)